MKSESIQARKLQLIEYLLGVQDEKLFKKLESDIHKSLSGFKAKDIVFTKNELIARAQFSAKQIKKGQVLSHEDLEKQSKNW